jgi:uncharacterized protein YuzE
MKVKYDTEHDMAYIYFCDIEAGGVAETFTDDTYLLDGSTMAGIALDFDHERRLVGIDASGASARLPAELLATAERP